MANQDGSVEVCDPVEVEVFAGEHWYEEVNGTQKDFPSPSWGVEALFEGKLSRRVFEPPPPHRPATHWLDEVRLYAGGETTLELLSSFEDQQVIVWGKTGDVCSATSGFPDLCVPEIWAATIRRACD